MKIIFHKIIFTLIITCFLASCAPKVSFQVINQPKLPVKNIDNIEIGKFSDESGKVISIPQTSEKIDQTYKPLNPVVKQLRSNKNTAHLVRGLLVSNLTLESQYRLLNTEEGVQLSGSRPDPAKTAILSAKVRYFENDGRGSEKLAYVLIAKNQPQLPLFEKIALTAATITATAALESSGKGFKVPTPYIEKIGAMEVEFHLTRKSNNTPIIPPQTFRSYYLRKWGGDSETSHAIIKIKQPIIEKFPAESSLFDSLISDLDNIELALLDPDEFLAQGGNLKQHDGVADTSLEIRYKLAKLIADQYIQQISQYTTEVTLNVASGDPIAVNLLNGNAYERAINRLEGLPQRAEEDLYNLGLAYESIGDLNQANKYYQEALNQDPESKTYSAAVQRTQL